MKLNLDASNVKEVEVTVEDARQYLDGNATDSLSSDKIDEWLDEAQGAVHSGQSSEYYIVIKITK